MTKPPAWFKSFVIFLACILGPSAAIAVTITDGLTFAIASGSNTSVGTHFHSNSGGIFGNPPGKAEVGRFVNEEVRGLSEFDLTGLGNASSATASFNVFNDGGLFAGTNDFPFDGTILIETYSGNNAEDIADYQAPAIDVVGSFSTAALLVGDLLSFDVTSIYNDAIDNSLSSLGLRLRADPLNNDGGAWTFDTFRLTTDDATAVSEPNVLALLGVGLLGLGLFRSRRTSSSGPTRTANVDSA